jgi:hypothetical protein
MAAKNQNQTIDGCMKVIFLDVDGVLNSGFFLHNIREAYGDDIDRKLLQILADVVQTTDAKVVISSFWRYDDKLMAMLFCAFREFGIEDSIIGFTPLTIEDPPRVEEIITWLEGYDRYVIIDDDKSAGIGMGARFFLTDAKVGITEQIARRMIEYLQKDEKWT